MYIHILAYYSHTYVPSLRKLPFNYSAHLFHFLESMFSPNMQFSVTCFSHFPHFNKMSVLVTIKFYIPRKTFENSKSNFLKAIKHFFLNLNLWVQWLLQFPSREKKKKKKNRFKQIWSIKPVIWSSDFVFSKST